MDRTSNRVNRASRATATPTLFYRDQGSGHPVLLLHGFAEDGAIWDNQAAFLSAHCRLIIPDLPGCGRSAAVPVANTMEEMAAGIKELSDRLEIERFVLIGHSLGGYIALAFAAQYPERLHALGLFHSTAYPDSEEKKASRRKAIEFIRKNGAATFIRQSTPNLFAAYTREQHPELIGATIDRYAGFSPDSLVAYYEAMLARSDRTAILRQFSGPVFFIIGEDDTIIPLQQSLEQCYLPSLSHLHLIKNTGHEGMLESPATCNRVLLDFINFIHA
ncbi:MAG TPA: alpha/beta hydrolase [Puia sp.]|nr:alpha/beta hydrolase [Puia sp.]